jgi:hypothetical protein
VDARRLNPDGNERLTAVVGIVLVVLTVVELATLLLGLQTFLSLHVFVGLVLIPPIALKLASTGWRFTRYYTRSAAYRLKGAPRLAMRLLAPVLVAATVVLFGSGVAMGVLHGSSLRLARQLHGPSSVIWMILVGVHVLAHVAAFRPDLRLTEHLRSSQEPPLHLGACFVASLSPPPSSSLWVPGTAVLPGPRRRRRRAS